MNKFLCSLALASMTGCATVDTGLNYAEEISSQLTERSLNWICNRMSVRQWRATFSHTKEAWETLCNHAAPETSTVTSETSLDPARGIYLINTKSQNMYPGRF